MNQATAIIFHLTQAPLSSLVAFNKMGCTCLPKRITEIESMGFVIDRRSIVSKNRWGNRNDYNLYSLRKTRANQKLFSKLFGLSCKKETK